MEALLNGAYAAAGQPVQSGSVTEIPKGFQTCWSGASCQSFTGFRWDASGRITDFLVDGQPISGRLALGADSTGSGLDISSVSGYLSTETGSVIVVCSVHNVGQQTIGNVNPAFLPVFVTGDGSLFNYNISDSVLPGPLQPGESVAVIAVFNTRAITGQFSLRTNNQTEQVLVRTTLRKL